MAHHRRAPQAVLGATLLVGSLAAGALGTAGASTPAGRPALRAATARAAQAPSSERVAVTLTVTLQGQRLPVSLTGVAGPTVADLHLVAAGTAIEVRRLGGTVYVHFPPGTKTGLPAGKSWGSVSLAAVDRQLGIVLPGLSPAGKASSGTLAPDELLAAIKKLASGPLRKVGAAKIHGIATTAYRASVDPAKLLGAAAAAASPTLKQLLGSVLKLKSVPFTIWVDAAGQVVQLNAAVPLALSFAGAKIDAKVAVLAQQWAFGVPVHVVAPPASQVAPIPLSALRASGAGALGGLGGLG